MGDADQGQRSVGFGAFGARFTPEKEPVVEPGLTGFDEHRAGLSSDTVDLVNPKDCVERS
jgi:hypothetical protein